MGLWEPFFAQDERLAIVHASETQGGTRVGIHEEAMSHAFSGHFNYDEALSVGVGNMLDEYGPSKLTIEALTDDIFIFYKEYPRSGSLVVYRMQKHEDGLWVGTYTGPTGAGEARCFLIDMPPELFNILPPATAGGG